MPLSKIQPVAQANGGAELGMRNRIINGDMRIDQRNNGAVSSNAINSYFLDRWAVSQTTTGKLTAQQNAGNVTPPPGFSHYLGLTSLSAFTLGSNDSYSVYQWIEGYNIADLSFGTSNAKSVTVSFWVYTSATGVYSARLVGAPASSYMSYVTTFTVAQANTWQYISFTAPGCTTGTWEKTNSTGLALQITVAAGSAAGAGLATATLNSWIAGNYCYSTTQTANAVGATGAVFYITGIQLEKGSVATPFEYRPYGTELALCQRYYENVILNTVFYAAQWTGGQFYGGLMPFLVEKRATPSIANFTSTGYWVTAGTQAFCANASHNFTIGYTTTRGFNMYCNRVAGNGTPVAANMYLWEGTATIPVSAEL